MFSPERATPLLPLVLLMTVSRNGKQEICPGQQFANESIHYLTLAFGISYKISYCPERDSTF